MRCDQARDRIGPLLDGELSADERRAISGIRPPPGELALAGLPLSGGGRFERCP
jgi:hypothetical protein